MAREPPKPVDSLISFVEALKGFQQPNGFLAFRGQRKTGWKIEPAIMRPPLLLLKNEKSAVRDLISIHPQEFSSDQTMFDRLVRMQHFGLPTRLLDVTANPLVALYFATEANPAHEGPSDGEVLVHFVPNDRKKYFDSDAISCVANLANLLPEEKDEISSLRRLSISDFNNVRSVDRLLQFIRREKPYFRSEIDPQELFRANYVVPKLDNRRIIAQAGAFLIFGISTDPARESPRPAITGKRILIGENSKHKIRNDLNLLGINEIMLFPEIEKAALYISHRYGSQALV